MITTKAVKIKKSNQTTSEYIEAELEKLGFDFLRWAIVAENKDFYTLSISYIK